MSSVRCRPRSSPITSRCGCWSPAIRRSSRRSKKAETLHDYGKLFGGKATPRRRPRRRPRPHRRSTRRISSTGRAIPIWRPAAATGPTTGSASPRSASVAAEIGTGALAAFRARRRPLPRLARRPRAGPAALSPGPGGEVGDDHPQPRLPGHLPVGGLSLARPARCRLHRRWRRVLRQRQLHEGRPAVRRRRHHGQPVLRRRDLHAGRRHGLRRPAARPPRRALRHPQRHRHRRLEPGHRSLRCRRPTPPPRSAAAPSTAARVEEAFGLDAGRGHGLLRGQPADLAEGHGSARRLHRRPGRPRRPSGRARHRRFGAGGHVPRRRLAPPRPRRRDRRL